MIRKDWIPAIQRFFRRISGNESRIVPPDAVPPRPPDWTLTIADLMAEIRAGKRKGFGRPEMEWAKDYERSLLPEGIRFPQKGDVYEALRERPVEYLTAWAAPFTGSGTGTLHVGERIWVHSETREEKPIGTYALPVAYRELEERMVPAEERGAPKYGGFYFYLSTQELNTDFKLIRTGYNPFFRRKWGERG